MTVDDILQSVLPRLAGTKPTCSIFDAIRGVQSIIVNLLLRRRSDLMVQPVDVDYASTDSSATLPDGFSSMAERPAVVGGNLLSPLQGPAYGDLLTAGDPLYYDVIGTAFTLYPPPAADVSVKIKAFVRPVAPAQLDAVIPFQGVFDEVYAYGAHAVMVNGPAVIGDRAFAVLIESQVNEVLTARDLADEQMLADSINFPG